MLWHITNLPEPFRSQEIERVDSLPFPRNDLRQMEFWNKWMTYIYVNAGRVQSFPSYEWIHDPMTATKIYPQIAADLRDYCLQIIAQ